MRPQGVYDRIRQTIDDEREYVHSRPEYALRVQLTGFIGLCARLWYKDFPVSTVLRAYRDARRHLDDPAQVRTGTDFERRSLAGLHELWPLIGQLAQRVETASFDEQDLAYEPLVEIPSAVVLGRVGSDSHYHLGCWNQANSLLEGVQTPYRAARGVTSMKIQDPPDVYGLIPPLSELVERYEDEAHTREATGRAIMNVFAGFMERAPWPVT